jgi:membrane fusion protein (multidrug efflux system)
MSAEPGPPARTAPTDVVPAAAPEAAAASLEPRAESEAAPFAEALSLTRPKPRLGRLALRALLLVLVPLAAAAAGLYVYATGGRYVVTENAYVKANLVAVSADVSGRVVWVGVADNQTVAAGEPLFQIDPVPFEIALAGAEAELAVVLTELGSLKADYREAQAAMAEAAERARFLELQYQRQKQLRARGVGTEAKFDAAQHELETARQRVTMIGERAENVLASLSGDADLKPRRHPRYLRIKAQRDQAALDLERGAVLAPAAGVVSNMKLQPGEHVEAGTPVFSVIEAEPLWIEANLKETQLTHVREGQPATLVVDAYPDQTWGAEVTSISPATGAEFALLPPQNATGNWVKVVQRVPVHLAIAEDAGAPRLRAGMTVRVSIDTGRERDLGVLVQEALAWSERQW